MAMAAAQQRREIVVPSPSLPESSFPLTFFDIFWLNSPPVEHLFFYRLALDTHLPSILSNLKASLSHALHAFYPLAGRLRLTPGTPNRYELHYRPGDGVTFTVAEYPHPYVSIDELATDDPREIAKIAPLVPPLPKDGAVLTLQATLLRHGLALGVTMHHAACDGVCSTHFLHTWAAACTGADAPPLPVIDRTLLPDPRGLYDIFYQDMPTSEEMEHVKMSDDQLLATFTLSKEDMEHVKSLVAGEAARRGLALPRCSSLVATLGFIWSCYQRAKEAASGSEGDPTYMLFPVDHRSRMKPSLPDKYFGNCVGPAIHGAPKDQLAAAGAGGIYTACAAVAAAIEEAVGGMVSSDMDVWMERVREIGGAGVLSVAGSPRFCVYDVDLGLGRPAKVDIVSVAKTGAMAVVESRSSAGGGMEVGISLPRAGMVRFQNCFADAIAWLHNRRHGVVH